ncbi:MAG TPA: heat-inducible transcriptional repressor HrcA [bacterium]|nr:heat-inducible transcriptional repressor HrcA [bacterium]
MAETAPNRNETVLSTVIHRYVATAKPVASFSLSGQIRVSPATIRNVFAALEDRGYLTHPHTSAGRVPTDEGYRFYVDRLMRARELNLREKRRIEEEYGRAKDEVEALMRHTAKILSAMTRLGGLAVFHPEDGAQLDHFKLVSLDPRKVMVILVLTNGLVEEELVRLESPLPAGELARVTHLLNGKLKGLSLGVLRRELLSDAERLRDRQLGLVQAALKTIDDALDLEGESIQLEGLSQLMEQPEFKTLENLERLVRLVEERRALRPLLDRQWSRPGLAVEIGEDSGLGAPGKNLSFMHLPYRLKGRVAGLLGVWGPTRMDYGRVAGLMGQVARSLEEALNTRGGWS